MHYNNEHHKVWLQNQVSSVCHLLGLKEEDLSKFSRSRTRNSLVLHAASCYNELQTLDEK